MSWDIIVQDLPAGITSVKQIPDDFKPGPIGSRQIILREIQAIFPEAEWFDEEMLSCNQPGCTVDIYIRKTDPCTGFGLAVYGGDAVPYRIAALLERLNLRAFDGWAKSGLFDLETAKKSLKKQEAYRDQINQKPPQ